MTDQAIRVTPAGWYEDPADPAARVRWWNGEIWTDHVAEKPTASASTAAVAEPRAAVAEVAEVAPSAEVRSHAETSGAAALAAAQAIVAAAEIEAETAGPAPADSPAARTDTLAVWMIALLPVVAAALIGLAGYVYLYVERTPLVALVGVLVWALGFLWAVADRRVLVRRGVAAPHPALALVLPVVGPLLYLGARRARGRGAGPLAVFLALTVAVVGIPATALLSGSALPVTTALGIQNTIRDDLLARGVATSVSCPAVLDSWAAGSLFTCDYTDASGYPGRVWVSFDDYAGSFSWSRAR